MIPRPQKTDAWLANSLILRGRVVDRTPLLIYALLIALVTQYAQGGCCWLFTSWRLSTVSFLFISEFILHHLWRLFYFLTFISPFTYLLLICLVLSSFLTVKQLVIKFFLEMDWFQKVCLRGKDSQNKTDAILHCTLCHVLQKYISFYNGIIL